MKKVLVGMLVAMIVAAGGFMISHSDVAAEGQGSCGPYDYKAESAPFTWTAPAGYIISQVTVKAGSQTQGDACFGFTPGNPTDGCYLVTWSPDLTTATATKVGSGPSCKDISHVEFVLGVVPPPVPGCMDPEALNYNPDATVDDGSCEFPPELCTLEGVPEGTAIDSDTCEACPYEGLGNLWIGNPACVPPEEEVPGCTNPAALNYNPEATVDDGTCEYPPEEVPGCTNPDATNYNPDATVDDGSCEYPPEEVPGCIDPEALNYNPDATVDDGSCEYKVVPPPVKPPVVLPPVFHESPVDCQMVFAGQAPALTFTVYKDGVPLEAYTNAPVDVGQPGFWKITLYKGLSGIGDIQVGDFWLRNVDLVTCEMPVAPPAEECDLYWGAGVQTSRQLLIVNVSCDPHTDITIDGVTTTYVLPAGRSEFLLQGSGTLTVTIQGEPEVYTFDVNFGAGPLTATLR